MTLFSIISSLRAQARAQRSDAQPADSKLALRLSEVFRRTWDLGFTAFGGPPVHFQILHRRFVEGLGFQGGSKWIDEQTVSSTVCVLRSATDRCAIVSRVVRNMSSTSWSSVHKDALQHHADSCWARFGGLCLFAMELAWGVQKMPDRLPPIVYALLSGMNASTVGIIALAAVQVRDN
jgi:hypothetical protein